MNTTSPSPPLESRSPRRRRWPWVVGLCLAPFVILGLMATSYLSLDGEAAALRRYVMNATDASWKTKVQISVGGLTLGGLRMGLKFVTHPDVEKARLGLRAVTRASVGVFQRDAADGRLAINNLLVDADRGMRHRGWSRVIGVSGKGEFVVAYMPTNTGAGRLIDVCLAVIKDRELVVVSARLDAEALAVLVQQNLPEELRKKFLRPLQTATR